jgi:hypothetical protein
MRRLLNDAAGLAAVVALLSAFFLAPYLLGYGCARLACDEPVYGGPRLGWTCLGANR